MKKKLDRYYYLLYLCAMKNDESYIKRVLKLFGYVFAVVFGIYLAISSFVFIAYHVVDFFSR